MPGEKWREDGSEPLSRPRRRRKQEKRCTFPDSVLGIKLTGGDVLLSVDHRMLLTIKLTHGFFCLLNATRFILLLISFLIALSCFQLLKAWLFEVAKEAWCPLIRISQSDPFYSRIGTRRWLSKSIHRLAGPSLTISWQNSRLSNFMDSGPGQLVFVTRCGLPGFCFYLSKFQLGSPYPFWATCRNFVTTKWKRI